MLKLLIGNPWVLIGIAAAFVITIGWGTMEHVGRVAAEKGEKAARLESDLHAQDTVRWQNAAEARLAQIVGLSDQMTRQNADVAASAAARDRAEQHAAAAATEAAKAETALNDLTQRWEKRANEHPEDVRPLGPVACAAYASLYGEAAACPHSISPAAH